MAVSFEEEEEEEGDQKRWAWWRSHWLRETGRPAAAQPSRTAKKRARRWRASGAERTRWARSAPTSRQRVPGPPCGGTGVGGESRSVGSNGRRRADLRGSSVEFGWSRRGLVARRAVQLEAVNSVGRVWRRIPILAKFESSTANASNPSNTIQGTRNSRIRAWGRKQYSDIWVVTICVKS